MGCAQTMSWFLGDAEEAGAVDNRTREGDRHDRHDPHGHHDQHDHRDVRAVRDERGSEGEKGEGDARRSPTVDAMRALVGEAEDVEARVRTRSRRMRGPSASPDASPLAVDPMPPTQPARPRASAEADASPPTNAPATNTATNAPVVNASVKDTMGPPLRASRSMESDPTPSRSGEALRSTTPTGTLASIPAPAPSGPRSRESGRYSFVSPPRRAKKKG